MAELPDVFIASENEPMIDFDPAEPGFYTLEITRSQIKKVGEGKAGRMLSLQAKIISAHDEENEKHKGKMVFINLNLVNKSEVAVRIAKAELRSICDACNLEEVEDSEELHEIEFGAKLGIEKGANGYEDKSKVKKYYTMEEYDLEDKS